MYLALVLLLVEQAAAAPRSAIPQATTSSLSTGAWRISSPNHHNSFTFRAIVDAKGGAGICRGTAASVSGQTGQRHLLRDEFALALPDSGICWAQWLRTDGVLKPYAAGGSVPTRSHFPAGQRHARLSVPLFSVEMGAALLHSADVLHPIATAVRNGDCSYEGAPPSLSFLPAAQACMLDTN